MVERNSGFLRTVPPITKVFSVCAVYSYAGKADHSKGRWNPERNLGVTAHFLERNLESKCHTL